MADNNKIDIRLELKHLPAALELALAMAPGGRATHFLVHRDYGMILFWTYAAPFLPSEEGVRNRKKHESSALTVPSALEFVTGWIKGASPSDFTPNDPRWDVNPGDYDVGTTKGFRMYNEDWGHVAGEFSGIVAIKPVYMWHGK